MFIPAKLLDLLVERGQGAIAGGFAFGVLTEGGVLMLHLRGVHGEILEHVQNIGWMGGAFVIATALWLRSKKNAEIATEAKAIAVEAAVTSTMAAEAQGVRVAPSTIPEVERATTAKRRMSTGVRIR